MNIIQDPDSKNYSFIQQLNHISKQRKENAIYDNHVVGFGENFVVKKCRKNTLNIVFILLFILVLCIYFNK